MKTKISVLRYIIFAVLFLAFMLVLVFLGGNSMLNFLDIPSLIVVLGITWLWLLPNYSFGDMMGYVGMALNPGKTDDVQVIEQGILFFQYSVKYLLMSGGIGFMTGIIGMLSNLENTLKVGQNLAVALLTVFYSLIIVGLFPWISLNSLKKRKIDLK